MQRLLNSLPLLYLAMLWPGRFTIWGLYDDSWYYAQMMFETGILSVWLLIVTIAVSPALVVINLLGRGKGLGRWLLQRRRHFGIGSFIYAALHLAHYTLETASLSVMAYEALWLDIALGWGAFVVFAALAVTSNNWSVRRLGRGWKRLHYLIYPAAAFAFLHWYLFDFFTERVLFWVGVFVAVKLIHGALRSLSLVRKPAGT